MIELLIALLGIETSILIPVVGYLVKLSGRLRTAEADASGWHQSYDREHETTERYRRAEDMAAQQRMITNGVLAALGKLPKDDES